MDYIVQTTDLVKHFSHGRIKAVDGLNLKIEQGEIYSFIGANGSGKTTTLNMVAGVLKPTSGKIEVMGLPMPNKRHILSRHMGIAPQEYSVYLDLTVEENIDFFANLYKLKKKDIKDKKEELLEQLNLSSRRKEVAKNLSGGMKRRLSIACSLIHSPSLLVFDEATVGVDPVLREKFWKYFRSIRDAGNTIIVTSHVMDEAEKADRIGLMRAGLLIEEGTPQELKTKHNCKTIEEIFLKLSEGVVADE